VPEFGERERQEMRAHAEVARDASVELARQMAILWEARVNLAMTTGDDEALRTAIAEAKSVAYLDNCNCSTGGVLA
jgi:hypothetical protein